MGGTCYSGYVDARAQHCRVVVLFSSLVAFWGTNSGSKGCMASNLNSDLTHSLDPFLSWSTERSIPWSLLNHAALNPSMRNYLQLSSISLILHSSRMPMCIQVSVCSHICISILVCIAVWVYIVHRQKTSLWVPFLKSCLPRFLMSWDSPSRLDWLASYLWNPLSLLPQCWNYNCSLSCLTFLCGFWKSNSLGTLVYKTSMMLSYSAGFHRKMKVL